MQLLRDGFAKIVMYIKIFNMYFNRKNFTVEIVVLFFNILWETIVYYVHDIQIKLIKLISFSYVKKWNAEKCIYTKYIFEQELISKTMRLIYML